MCHDIKAKFHSGIIQQEANITKTKDSTIMTIKNTNKVLHLQFMNNWPDNNIFCTYSMCMKIIHSFRGTVAHRRISPTKVLIRVTSSFFLFCLIALFCFSIHLLSSRLPKQRQGQSIISAEIKWGESFNIPTFGLQHRAYFSPFSFSSSSRYENSLHESKLYLQEKKKSGENFNKKWHKEGLRALVI